jgi:hypothetical protein
MIKIQAPPQKKHTFMIKIQPYNIEVNQLVSIKQSYSTTGVIPIILVLSGFISYTRSVNIKVVKERKIGTCF